MMSPSEILCAGVSGLSKGCFAALAVLAAVGVGASLFCLARGFASALRRRLSRPGAAVAAALCLYAAWCGGTKRGVPPGGGGHPRGDGGAPSAPTVTAEDAANGWRLESVATNAAFSYAMPSNGVEYAYWSRRGGRETYFALDLGGFPFPYGTGALHRVEVLSGGTAVPLPRAPARPAIRAAREWASLVPGVSRFWTADAGGGAARLLTWENVRAGRDGAGAYSAQVELRAGGDFATRSNGVERVYRRVPPFDWDGDGLENSVDPDPFAAGPDAHGTNAEWFNNVCSNVFLAADPPGGGFPLLAPRSADVDTNAYYFVDFVAADGPAPVYFSAGRESRLGSPAVVALPGATNRVPLLIGVEYAVTSPVPLTLDAPAEAILSNAGGGVTVVWPAAFTFTPETGNPGVLSVSVSPARLSGGFEWTDGCCVSARGNPVAFNCGGDCGCGGCALAGTFSYEGCRLPLSYAGCGCGGGDPPGGGGTNGVDGLSVGLSLARDAVLFETAYTNAPGEVVPGQSTFAEISLNFSSGGRPASVSLSVPDGAGAVRLRDGGTNGPVVAGWCTNLPANVAGSHVFYAEGVARSAAPRDIRLRGMAVDSEGMALSNRRMTAAEVEVLADDTFPTNRHRHIFGPLETAKIIPHPAGLPIQLNGNVPFDGSNALSNNVVILQVPSKVSSFSLEVSSGGNSLALPFRVIGPSDTQVAGVHLPTPLEWSNDLDVEPLGIGDIGAALHIEVSLRPDTVSFMHINVMEGETEAVEREGYFTNAVFTGFLNHTVNAGAFSVVGVEEGNIVGNGDNLYLGLIPENLPTPITDGSFGLHIPLLWFVENGEETNQIACIWSYNAIYANADVEVGKYGVSARRGTNDVTRINRESEE